MTKLIIGYCWGAAGSRWLSRFMNAHPDVWFSHGYPYGPGRPMGNYLADQEACIHYIRFMDRVSSHPYIGMIHRIPIKWHKTLLGLGYPTRAFVLIRHPILRIRSVMALNTKNQSRAKTLHFGTRVGRATKKLTFPFNESAENKSFLSACELMSHCMQDFDHGLPIFRIEDLGEPLEARKLMSHCFGLGLAPGQEGLLGYRIGVHAGGSPDPKEIWEGWPEEWRRAYMDIMPAEVKEHLGRCYKWVP